MTQDELRKRAKEVLLAHSTKQSVTEHEVDAMLAFAAECVAAERSDAVDAAIALCYAHGEINAAEALERNKKIISKLSCVEKGASDAAA